MASSDDDEHRFLDVGLGKAIAFCIFLLAIGFLAGALAATGY